jgi:hypothetical protein
MHAHTCSHDKRKGEIEATAAATASALAALSEQYDATTAAAAAASSQRDQLWATLVDERTAAADAAVAARYV